jgi:hypothetical protein
MHAEIRGRSRAWRVWTPNAQHYAHSVPLYDQEGNLKEMLLVGEPPGKDAKYVECYGGPFSSIEEATEYAHYLGYEDVRVAKTMTKQESLAKARAVRASEHGG